MSQSGDIFQAREAVAAVAAAAAPPVPGPQPALVECDVCGRCEQDMRARAARGASGPFVRGMARTSLGRRQGTCPGGSARVTRTSVGGCGI